jgi:thioredoxin reductase (NADPH)
VTSDIPTRLQELSFSIGSEHRSVRSLLSQNYPRTWSSDFARTATRRDFPLVHACTVTEIGTLICSLCSRGGIDVSLPDAWSGSKIYNQIRAFNFSGEYNLLNSQGAVVEARTIAPSLLLRVPRAKLRELMRAEGDIANLLIQACIWRRLGIMEAAVSGVTLKGYADDLEMLLLRRFLLRNIYPHHVTELAQENGSEAGGQTAYPVVQLPDGRILERPQIPDLADELGITEVPDSKTIFDVAVVGAGPAGLAAAVYAASEGLSTVVIEAVAPGGQAGTSSKIENYLGFPTGIGGQQLAIRAQMQALKFGVHFAISREVVAINQTEGVHKLTLAGGHTLCVRSVVVATGARYRTLDVKNYRDYENRGLYYCDSHGRSDVQESRGHRGWWR